MATPWNLTDFENRLLLTIREMDAVNFGGVPNFGLQFNKTLTDQEINQAVADFMQLSGCAPRLIDRFLNTPVTSALDYPLPADAISITRIEYQQAPTINTTVTSGAFAAGQQTVTLASITENNGTAAVFDVGTVLQFDTLASGVQEQVQITAINSVTKQVTGFFEFAHGAGCIVQSQTTQPYALRQLTPDLFDRASGNGYPGLTVNSLGLPSVFREPMAIAQGGPYCTRFYQAIGSQQVANGDSINTYYSSYGANMVANADTSPVPVLFQRAVVLGAAIPLWLVKGDEEQSDKCQLRFNAMCKRAMGYRWELPAAGTFGFEDESGQYGPDNWTQW